VINEKLSMMNSKEQGGNGTRMGGGDRLSNFKNPRFKKQRSLILPQGKKKGMGDKMKDYADIRDSHTKERGKGKRLFQSLRRYWLRSSTGAWVNENVELMEGGGTGEKGRKK